MKKSKKTLIEEHLLAGKTITQKEAIELFNSYRLSGEIYKLKQQGHDIVMSMKKTSNGCVFGEYSIRRA